MLEVSRRSVMVFGASAVAVVATGALAAPAAAGVDSPLPRFIAAAASAYPLRSHFAGHEGETFLATAESGAIAVTLSSIEDVPPVTQRDDENRFNLIFTAHKSTQAFTQGIYELTHPSVPAATLFIALAGAAEKRQLQVLVNRSA